MAWDGVVKREIESVWPNPRGGCRITFRGCGHGQESEHPAMAVLRSFREYPCRACSEPTVRRIAQIREAIQFDDVLAKVKELARNHDGQP